MTEPADADTTDHVLLRRSADGDRRAFEELMSRHAGGIHRFLLASGAGPADAEDVLQDTFVGAWRGAGSFAGEGSVRSWLFAIARNALRRQYRRHAGEPARFDSLDTLGVAAGWGSADEFEHRFAVEDELRWALERIPTDERDAVVLRDLEGLSGEEAAAALGVSLAALKSRLHRGRLHLMAVARGGGRHA